MTATADQAWTLLAVLRASEDFLKQAGLPGARREAEELLSHSLACSRLELYVDYDRPLGEDERAVLRPLLRRRARREPLQYILGCWPFRELELKVDARALIPRPETEELLELVLEHTPPGSRQAIDAGCGGGCIALSLLRERPDTQVLALDASEAALELCRENAEANGIRKGLECLQLDLLRETPPAPVDLLVSNPPYVEPAQKGQLQPELAWEPGEALYTKDPEGLEFYRRFRDTLPAWLKPGGAFFFEIGERQGPRLLELFRDGAKELHLHKDMQGRTRFLRGLRS